MALDLVAVGVNTSEEICPAVNVQHDAVALARALLAVVEVSAHLDPLRLEFSRRTAPLPPLLTTYARNPIGAELSGNSGRGGGEVSVRDDDGVELHPMRRRNPLAGEVLCIFDGMFCSVDEKSADDLNAFVIGDMHRGLLVVGFAVDVLRRSVGVVNWARGLA